MVALLSVLSFVGFIACAVFVIINAIRKRTVKPMLRGMAGCFVILVICLVLTPSGENSELKESEKQANKVEMVDTESGTEEPEMTISTEVSAESETGELETAASMKSSVDLEAEEKFTEEKEIESETEETQKTEYDNLQKVFLAITKDTTEEDILVLIEDYGLEYTMQDYNGTPKTNHYKLAYTHDVALQKYADSGDSLEISFSKEDGSLMYAEYFNQESFKNAIYYSYGTYWDFREKEPNNSYSGYYYHTPGESKGGITMKYSNGNSTETGYHDVNSGEDALANIL